MEPKWRPNYFIDYKSIKNESTHNEQSLNKNGKDKYEENEGKEEQKEEEKDKNSFLGIHKMCDNKMLSFPPMNCNPRYHGYQLLFVVCDNNSTHTVTLYC